MRLFHFTLLLVCFAQTMICQNTTVADSQPIEDNQGAPTVAEDRLWGDFSTGVTQSFFVIFLSEIGDKTFIMVTVLASSVNKFSLFLMASLATAIMHTVSVMIGAFLAFLIPKMLIQIIVISLFTGFGLAMLHRSYNIDKQKEE